MKIFVKRLLTQNKNLLTKMVYALLRIFGWSAGFSGIISMSVCPFCGKQGCIVGGASAGLLGALFGILIQWGGKLKSLRVKWPFKPASKPLL